jgi:hypothetical protein
MTFEKEFKEIVRVIAGIERHSEENDPALDKQLDLVNTIFDDFQKKYPKLSIKIESRIEGKVIRLFIHEDSVRAVFDESASKLKGLTGIGLNSFDEATIKEADQFSAAVNNIKNSVFLTYSTEAGTETIVLQFNDKEKKVELNYEISSLANTLSPQFQLLKQYASKETNNDISFLDRCYELGFTDIEDKALFDWEDEFYPKMLE